MKLKGKMLRVVLFSERKPKCVLCDAVRLSERPEWSYVWRIVFEKAMSVWPAKYLVRKPPHTTDARPIVAHSGTIWTAGAGRIRSKHLSGEGGKGEKHAA